MIMYHLDQKHIGDGSRYAYNWLGKQCPTAGEVADIMLNFAFSPCMWAGGERKKKFFRHAEWLGLDFDAGPSLKDVCNEFEGYLHIIGTTKSHQVRKEDGSIGDRFRVLLKLSQAIYHGPTYENTVTYFINKYGADPACKDSARFFWPSKEIVSLKYHGTVVDPIEPKKRSKKYNDYIKKNADRYRQNGILPARVSLILERGTNGGRNKASYCVARDLKKLGYTIDETVNLIMNSAIPNCGDHGFAETECRRTVLSAFDGK